MLASSQNKIGSVGEKISSGFDNISKSLSNTVNSASNLGNSVTSSIMDAKSSVSNNLNDFSSKVYLSNAGTDFLNSNSIVAKFAFFILVLIIFIMISNLGIKLIGYILQPPTCPYIVKGLLQGSNSIIVTQDPSIATSIPIQRSNNQSKGIEFTWGIWLFINKNKTSSNGSVTYQNIFNKGDSSYDNSSQGNGQSKVSNGPGLYLSTLKENVSSLRVVMDSVNSNVGPSIIEVEGIPFNKWCHVIIRLENKVLDVYVNGTLTSRLNMPDVAKQNYNDINICQNGGFTGQLSNLRYFNYALSAFEINSMVVSGPNLTTSTLSNASSNNSPYFLSSSWFSQQR
jgi:hypothetical protein